MVNLQGNIFKRILLESMGRAKLSKLESVSDSSDWSRKSQSRTAVQLTPKIACCLQIRN